MVPSVKGSHLTFSYQGNTKWSDPAVFEEILLLSFQYKVGLYRFVILAGVENGNGLILAGVDDYVENP